MSKGRSQDETVWVIPEKENIAKQLIKVNSKEYNLLKAAEELQELALALTQKVNKPSRDNEAEIIDEIGDVKIRIKVLEEIFDKKAIKARILMKKKKYEKLIKNGLLGTKYIGI